MNGKNKKKYIIAITAILLAACIAAVTGIFAWMTNTKSISKMGFQISQISCKVKMYKGLESDYNGVPDLLGVGEGSDVTDTGDYGKYLKDSAWTSYTTSDIYYKEKYSFEFLENKSMLSSEASANTFSTVTLEDVEPSRVYVYKFSVANEASVAGTLNYSFAEYASSASSTTDSNGNTTWTSLDASAFQCRMFTVINSSEDKRATEVTYQKYTTTTTEWFDLEEGGTELASVDITAADSKVTDKKINRNDMVDIWLQIRMNPEIANAADNTANIFNQPIELPDFIITFTAK